MKSLNVKTVVILNEGDKIASRFCKDIRNIEVLSRESEIEYFNVYQNTKCSKAREKIIKANLKFVVSVARKFATGIKRIKSFGTLCNGTKHSRRFRNIQTKRSDCQWRFIRW